MLTGVRRWRRRKQALVGLVIAWLIIAVLIGYALHRLYGRPLWFAITLMLTSGSRRRRVRFSPDGPAGANAIEPTGWHNQHGLTPGPPNRSPRRSITGYRDSIGLIFAIQGRKRR